MFTLSIGFFHVYKTKVCRSFGTVMKSLTVIFALLFLFVGQADTSWLWMGVASIGTKSTSVTSTCNRVPGLSTQQLKMCMLKPDVIPSVSEGAKIAINECKLQFKHERWNCSTSNDETVFGRLLEIGSKETAFVHAITSAGVVHAVSKSCSKGNLSECECSSKKNNLVQRRGWELAGCNDNIKYAIWLSQTFVDAPEKSDRRARSITKGRALMNLHNNQAGRQAVVALMKPQCRCHGVSSSCAVKTCWNSVPNFDEVGAYLKDKYLNAIPVVYVRRKKKLRREDRKKWKLHVPNTALIHLDLSPNYCEQNQRLGIVGTSGRECKKNSTGRARCELLCCGGGYNTRTVRETRSCACKFIWCCKVKCKQCESIRDKYTCK